MVSSSVSALALLVSLAVPVLSVAAAGSAASTEPAATAVPAVAAVAAVAAPTPARDPVHGADGHGIAAALADPARPAEQVARDDERHPAELLAFAGIKAGDRVADFMSGGAYFTRLFSRVVGDGGRVYAFLPEEELRNCAPAETAGTRSVEHDARYANVTVLTAPVALFHPPEPLDLVWTSLNFHDLYDSFMGPADVPRVAAALFASLRPGGVLVVVDHVAAAGSKVRDTETLHRIDPDVIIEVLLAAGFRLEAQSDLLRSAADSHAKRVFDPAIRGRTDQVVLRFRKPPGIAALRP
jgi:predicted methyltransferase